MQCISSSSGSTSAISHYLVALTRDAVDSWCVHPDSAQHAARVTLRRLGGDYGAQPLDHEGRRRVRAYYRAVLRNAALERARPADREYRQRLKVASLVDDLRTVNASDARIRGEVEAFFGPGALAHLPGAIALS
jgi:hypothetical protein